MLSLPGLYTEPPRPSPPQTEDPREEILKYAKMAEENPVFVSPAYTVNQPVGADPTAGTYPKFAKTVEPEDEKSDED